MLWPLKICPLVAMTLCAGVSARTWYVDQRHPDASDAETLFVHDFPIKGFNPFHQSPSIKVGRDIATYFAPVRPVEADQPLELIRGMLFLDGRPLRQITDVSASRFGSGVFHRAQCRHDPGGHQHLHRDERLPDVQHEPGRRLLQPPSVECHLRAQSFDGQGRGADSGGAIRRAVHA